MFRWTLTREHLRQHSPHHLAVQEIQYVSQFLFGQPQSDVIKQFADLLEYFQSSLLLFLLFVYIFVHPVLFSCGLQFLKHA